MLAGLVLLLVVVSQTDVGAEAVTSLWSRLSLARILAAFSVMTAGFAFLALRWRSLLPGDNRHIGIGGLTSILLVGTLLNYALPGPVGELAAAAMASRRYGVAGEVALAAGLHARFVGLGVAGSVALLLLVVAEMPVAPEYFPWIATATVAIAAGVIVLTLLSSRPALLASLSTTVVAPFSLLAPLHRSMLRFAEALGMVGRVGLRRYALAALWAFCGHGCVIGGILIAASGLGAEPAASGLAFTYTVATAGAVVLYAFPGSQVGWDGMFCALLVTTTGVSTPDALAMTLVVRIQQLLVVCLGALVLILSPRAEKK
ncbi:MAG TPA: lysylphosphatidylglycerol synthase transmembrane domain-containing protein [Myxococcota bacterium]|nr:lysylphosphatidylglycerol synthase transmembrane domain-containing protein [Myxococcota bacterium]HNH46499.1 lysylphosphatidylglycerol synthase transmembrane domain-containing protein [Myxococcota bacterium]